MYCKPVEALYVLSFLCTISFVMPQDEDSFIMTMKNIKALSDILLANQSKLVVPGLSGDFFYIEIKVTLLAVGEIDEIEEKLSTVFRFEYSWKDYYVRWNTSIYMLPVILLGWMDVWKPIFRVANPHTDDSTRRLDKTHDIVFFMSMGDAFYEEMMTTKTTCDLDMTFYPFDIQSCDIKFFIMGHLYKVFDLYVALEKGFDASDARHGSWNLISHNIEVDYGEFTVQLKFERRPLFILLNILLPIIVLALLVPIVFVLPKKSGERVGYAITMLLAISVYMIIVSDHLPQNSQPMPLISIMMFVWYIMDSLIVLIVIINTKINAMNDNKAVPYICQKFVHLTRLLSCQRKLRYMDGKRNTRTQERIKNCIEMETSNTEAQNNETKDSAKTTNGDGASRSLNKVSWQDLSHAIDKWSFALSYILKIALPIIFFTVTKFHRK